MSDDILQLRLVVTVADWDAAVAFYRDALGLPEEAAFATADTQVVILSAGRATLEIADAGHADFVDEVEVGRRVAGPVRVAFEVADSTAVTDRLARAGARVVAPPTLTPWHSLNSRLDAPGDLHVTVFADASDASQPRGEAEIMVGRVGAVERLDAQVVLAEPDPTWAATAAALTAEVERVLGDRALLVAHAGSTSVPGLAAKPIIDLVLAVRDPADEPSYVPALQALGYVLKIREPEWEQHRVLKLADPTVNLHVFALGSAEIDRMLAFRDHLRADPQDLDFYQRTKRGLARRRWEFVQQYADAKSEVVEQVVARALRGASAPPTGTYVVLPPGSGPVPAADLAAALGVPLLSSGDLAEALAGHDVPPDVTADALLALAAGSPAAVLEGDWPPDEVRRRLGGRVVAPAGLPATDDAEALARAVRQLSRWGGR